MKEEAGFGDSFHYLKIEHALIQVFVFVQIFPYFL